MAFYFPVPVLFLYQDPNSVINAIFQLGVPKSGGTTLFYDDKKQQLLGVPHRHGNMLLGPFVSYFLQGVAKSVAGVVLMLFFDGCVVKVFDVPCRHHLDWV